MQTRIRSRRWWWWILLIVLISGAAGAWYVRRQVEGATRYQTVAVGRGDLTQTVTATGQLNPVVNVQVGSQISGTIAELFADYNSQVTNGQVIAQIDPSTYEASVRQAEGDVANARAALELAQVNARRARELFDKQLIPQSDFDTSTAQLHQSEAALQIKEAQLVRARVDLARCTIESPVDGIVISRNVDVGQTVAASLSAPTLFVIANDLTRMQIDANVAEADIGGVEVGQDVEFTVDAFPNRTFRGRVMQVRNAPITVQNVVTYDTVIEVRNPDLRLKPGMTANVSIILAHRDDALRIPNAALRFRPPETEGAGPGEVAAAAGPPRGGRNGRSGGAGGGPGGGGARRERPATRTVYVLDADGQPMPVPVKLGISDGVSTEVLEGVAENDQVVTAAIVKSSRSAPAASPFGGGRRPF